MATDPYLIERIEQIMSELSVPWYAKKMFGGTFYMVDDKMCFGTMKRGMMVRVGANAVDDLSKYEHAELIYQKERVFKGFLLITPEGYDLDQDLEFWIQKCLDFNPQAKSSKKK